MFSRIRLVPGRKKLTVPDGKPHPFEDSDVAVGFGNTVDRNSGHALEHHDQRRTDASETLTGEFGPAVLASGSPCRRTEGLLSAAAIC